MRNGVSPVVATVLLIAIAVIGSVAVWYWVSPYTSQPALPQSIVGTGIISTPVTGVYKGTQAGSGATSIDIKNNVGAALSSILYYVYDRVTGLPVGVNGTNPQFQAFVNATSVLSGATANFRLLAYVNTSMILFPGAAYGVATDSGDNITVTGWSGTGMVTNKYYGNGTLIWSTPFSTGTGYEEGDDVVRDANNNFYVAASLSMYGAYDVLIKYNSAGAHVWNATSNLGTRSSSSAGRRIAIDSLNNTYIPAYVLIGNNYLIKFNSSGNQSWNATLGLPLIQSVAVDPANINNVYVGTGALGKGQTGHVMSYNSTGNCSWNITDFMSRIYDMAVDSVGNLTIVGRSGGGVGSISKISSNGGSFWNITVDAQTLNAIAFDSSNNATVVGYTADYRWYIGKFDPNGNSIWSTTFSYPWSFDQAYGVAIDSTNSIIVAGTSGGWVNATIVKYYANGSYAFPVLTAIPTTVPCPGAYTLRSTTSGIADVNFNC
jgi:flagellin-like protein